MSEKEIETKFNEVVLDKAAMKKLGAPKQKVYDWRNPERKNTSLAAKLEVLFKLNLLQFKNESSSE